MIVRSLVASIVLSGLLATGASAQVLLCPEAPEPDVAADSMSSETERLLKRLIIGLDLHGHRGVSEQEIMAAHADTPAALLGKLTNVVEHCSAASIDIEGFHDALPDLREAFIEATNVPRPSDADAGTDEVAAIEVSAENQAEAERVEESIDMSVRALWRKLWFRTSGDDKDGANRWAVIVASPPDADRGWDALGEHQRRWIDAYFQLHEPYYDSNPHHAIVAGRRLPRDQAVRLRDYVVDLGMAEDAFVWALPEGDEAVDSGEAGKVVYEVETEGEGAPEEDEFNLSLGSLN